MVRHLLPFEEVQTDTGSERKHPKVVCDILEFNGVAIGFDLAARAAHGGPRGKAPH